MINIPGSQATAKRDDFSLSLSLDEQAADSLWEQNERRFHASWCQISLGLLSLGLGLGRLLLPRLRRTLGLRALGRLAPLASFLFLGRLRLAVLHLRLRLRLRLRLGGRCLLAEPRP